MKIERLFQVLVVTGASSTVGVIGCGSDSDGGGGGGATGASGASSTGGTTASGGASTSTGGKATGGGSSAACDAVCHPSTTLASWTDCNGCCCWLPIGTMAPAGSPTCGEEPCCIGRGRK